jgi:hypothetical protein
MYRSTNIFLVNNMRLRATSLCFMVVLLLGNLGIAIAQHHRCARCGSEAECRKVCHLVCEDKKVSVTMWAGKAEEICVPGPSKLVCERCKMVGCENRDPNVPCAKPKKFTWTTWKPWRAPDVYTANKLMKRTTTQTIPSYKWVTEDLCPECQASVDLKK